MQKINLDTYCSLPFVGFDHRVKHVCCWTAAADTSGNFTSFNQCVKSDTIRDLQQDLLAGVKNKLCQTCWDQELVNVTSMRLAYLQNKNTTTIQEEISSKRLKHLVIDSGNICNLSCRTCWPESSSGLIKEFQEKSKKFNVGSFQDTIRHVDLDRFTTEDLESVETVNVLGGEPFQNLNHLRLLEHIIKIGRSSQCRLFYSTNGTVFLDARVKSLLEQFKTVHLSLSIDAIDQHFEYIRTNANWHDTLQNILDLMAWSTSQLKVSLSGHPTISCLNVLYLEPLFEWYSLNDLLWTPVFCESPKEYSFRIFQPHQKDSIVTRLSRSKFNVDPIIKQLERSTFDEQALSAFYRQIQFTKDYKKLDAALILPELLALLQI